MKLLFWSLCCMVAGFIDTAFLDITFNRPVSFWIVLPATIGLFLLTLFVASQLFNQIKTQINKIFK